jgi:hypothetical protein
MLQGGLSEQATTSAIHKIISAMKAEYGEWRLSESGMTYNSSTK